MKIKIICHFDTVEEMVHALQLITPAQSQSTVNNQPSSEESILVPPASHSGLRFFKKNRKVSDTPSLAAEKQDENKDKIMMPCPVCKNLFEKKYARKYCSKKCGQTIHNANYAAKHVVNSDKIKSSKSTRKNDHHVIDPPATFEPDPEPSGGNYGPF